MHFTLSELLDCLKNNTSLAWDSICTYTFTAALHKKPLRCQLASADWLRDFPPVLNFTKYCTARQASLVKYENQFSC